METEQFDIAPYEDKSRSDGKLNVAAFVSNTSVHGPGNRFALWLQSCHKRCPGCVNGPMLESVDRDLMDPEDLIYRIKSAIESVGEVEGLTIMGGEPTLQAGNLAKVIEGVRKEVGNCSVVLFSGYRHDTLWVLADKYPGLVALLEQTDTLIDGAFVASALDKARVAGSSNQQIIHLTDRLEGRDFTRMGAENIIGVSGAQVRAIRTGISIKK